MVIAPTSVVEVDLWSLESPFAVQLARSERLRWSDQARCGRFGVGRPPWLTGAEGGVVQSIFSRRAFVTALGMLSVPLFALAQDNKSREEKKEQAEEKRDEAKDKAEDAVDDRDKVVDGPGTDRSQDRRQDRRRDAVK